ncbi:AT-hook motif nuclear-localized protein 1-like [Lycium barbarum]|uniref:AT-hook motif nuclear-localized protein 1-like n=1 Tax=Lycium barbarum TaxID=112863 RepID=UPI00293EB29B|nr:AT-hook motif nuclear-localized protein 1-like [Lycium barbarum]XP_060207220.1 AT-hook motif nuclear-localized protein 1-like [Lycium barbarum]XP_060207221.1 AT-hook motif nuclear-localized protein 1-like [Lycium barbarum]XP_060207222.1 AT-hook motif nuclear-localized protein 1-like [Lycium barbarum]
MEGSNSGVTVVGSDAPSDYHVAPRTTTENNPTTTQPVTTSHVVVSPTAGLTVTTALTVKKKRGRPRKYAADGSVNVLSPKPISSSAPSPVIDFSSSEKRGKIRPVGLVSKPQSHHQPKVDLDTPGEWVSCSVGANFTPHIITVNTGEDITMKVISFSQQGPRAICILSANGVISSVTLRQPDSSGGTLTYEGRFEILSLTGSFMPSETGGMRNRSGGMSVSLVSPDGRVVGGGVAGLLVAAGPVQIVIGSFLAGDQHEHITKKNKSESVIAAVPLPETEDLYHSSVKQTMPASSSFRVDNWSAPDSRNKSAEINVTLPA